MKIFLYDDTFEGLLTSIYYGFYSESPPTSIYGKSESNVPLLLDEIIDISTEEDKFKKVMDAIIVKIDALCLKNIYIVYLSNYEEKGIIILKYLKIAFKLAKNTHAFLNIDVIRLIDTINNKVSIEIHRFKGFIRFNYIHGKFLYSSIEPDNDILELLGDHFMIRFSNEYFIIHDISREKALVYNCVSYEIISMSISDYKKLSEHYDQYSDLWRCYFESTTIVERMSPKLQSKMMPKRYWNHIFETQK